MKPPVPPRDVLLWLLVFATPVVLQLLAHVLIAFDPGNLLVDPAELSDEVTGWDGALTTMGIVAWATATVATWLAASLRGGDDLRSALVAVGGVSLLLGVDDRFLLHEKSGRIGIPEEAVLGAYGLLALAVVWRFRAHFLPRPWFLGAAAVGFAVSLGIDVIVEGWLELYVSGERFVEENAKLFGILAWAGFAVDLSRRSLQQPAAAPAEA